MELGVRAHACIPTPDHTHHDDQQQPPPETLPPLSAVVQQQQRAKPVREIEHFRGVLLATVPVVVGS